VERSERRGDADSPPAEIFDGGCESAIDIRVGIYEGPDNHPTAYPKVLFRDVESYTVLLVHGYGSPKMQIGPPVLSI
jgi:hypothetical protein